MKCHIFFHKFDTAKINQEGWRGTEGQLYLRLTSPLLPNQSIDALSDAISHKKFKYIGSIFAESHEETFMTLQNAFKSHPLNNRSMMTGDIVICDGTGKIVEPYDWNNLKSDQTQALLQLIK